MPANVNPHVTELLTWHGHAGGGVHVPFQSRSNPLGQVIETPLVRRLRAMAAEIAANTTSLPRWLFLVGGPGNGKSETVQDFLVALDHELGLNGALSHFLKQRFSSSGLLPRKVEVLPADLDVAGTQFAARVGRLVIVQDATATEIALGDAANELAHDLADLLTYPDQPIPVFVACANRGLLARTMNEAFREFGKDNPVTNLLKNVIQASSLGRETLAGRKSCWPLEADNRFACWPLDIESLLSVDAGSAPLETILLRAVEVAQWETTGRCEDCTSRAVCPFRQNAEWLRDETTRKNLLSMLRHGELARGQRWNFRDAYSLIAELVVGQWSDFDHAAYPCNWVHQKVAGLSAVSSEATDILALASQHFGNAMFRGGQVTRTARLFLKNRTVDAQTHPATACLIGALATVGDGASTKSIREMLARDYSRLDPANTTPSEPTHPLRLIEDAFCQSVEQGRTAANQSPPLSPVEDRLLTIFEKAEGEWDLLGRESAVAVAAVCLLRKLAAMLTKRSIGIRLGFHALEKLLASYESSLRNVPQLAKVRDALLPLLGDPGFTFNLVEIIGQPTSESRPLLDLQGQAPGVRVLPAPSSTTSTPGHDVPCVQVTDPNYRIPLTFDFYMALQLRKDGCAGSSLPASVRAALDRVRHRYAGELCRKEQGFVDGRTFIALGADKKIGVSASGSPPSLIDV
jgi:hypothetical protein